MTSARRFACRTTSISAVRRFAREALRDCPREVLDAVELMVSELGTNAVRHAHSDFEVTIRRSGHEIRVQVEDFGPGRPQVLNPTPTEPTGRGLRIVEAMSARWGVTASSAGKTVWFTLPDELRLCDDEQPASERAQGGSAGGGSQIAERSPRKPSARVV